MKKNVVAALMAAGVIGVGANVSAAANPFSDIPAGHWAYNSVAKLASAGVIEGYGDGTYRGDRQITRYEMAQMIAKAMAKNPTGANKAELDRLSAEFRDELDALGVRVAELEKYADKVVWTGELRYRYYRDDEKQLLDDRKKKTTNNQLKFYLYPTANVNDHWKVKAKLTGTYNMKEDSASSGKLSQAYADGTYGKFNLQFGKLPLHTSVDDGLLFDDDISGARIVYGDKFKVALAAGRWQGTVVDSNHVLSNYFEPASYQGGEVSYDNGKLFVGAGYHQFNSEVFRGMNAVLGDEYYKDSKHAKIWSIGANYKLGDVEVGGAYAQNSQAKKFNRSWTAGLAFKGANKKDAGTWGINANYRYLSSLVSFAPTYSTFGLSSDKKGVDIGVDWTPIDNTYVAVNYFTGKTLWTDKRTRTFYGRVSWFF